MLAKYLADSLAKAMLPTQKSSKNWVTKLTNLSKKCCFSQGITKESAKDGQIPLLTLVTIGLIHGYHFFQWLKFLLVNVKQRKWSCWYLFLIFSGNQWSSWHWKPSHLHLVISNYWLPNIPGIIINLSLPAKQARWSILCSRRPYLYSAM